MQFHRNHFGWNKLLATLSHWLACQSLDSAQTAWLATFRSLDSAQSLAMVKWTKLSYGDDFAGCGTKLAAKRLVRALPASQRPKLDHVFSCDKLRASRKLIAHMMDPPRLMMSDVTTQRSLLIAHHGTKNMDVYSADMDGALPEGWSVAGLQRGQDDPRSQVMMVGLATIENLKYKPKTFMSENVPTLNFSSSPSSISCCKSFARRATVWLGKS